jgi:hypothetical protein
MDDINEELARRDRYMRRTALQRTPAERLRKMAEMQKQAWEVLRNSPEGYARFLRRNFKQRAIDVRESDGR